jgi:hypothetical protein
MSERSTAEIFEELAKPMPYKWRLKQVANKAKKPYPEGARGQFLAYIDARDVFNRLDSVLGGDRWQDSVKRINEDGSVIISLSLCINGEWLTKEDIGYPNNPGAGVEEEPLKAAVSDGIKRAGVHFGVGRFLYDLPPTWTEIDAYGQPTRPLNNGSIEQRELVFNEPVAVGASISRTEQPFVASAEENQACAIDGCPGVCIGSWVGFSIRRYGVPLCSKHSAMAKRGEIDADLARLNASRGDEAA